MLQNKKYIQFADENTVEVMALQRLDEAIQKKERQAGTYVEKDEQGNEVEYMLEWPGLTAAQLEALNSSQAGRYNQSGGIPYTAIVDPHTLEEVKALPGGISSKTLMDEVETAKKALEKQHGPGTSRKVLRQVEETLRDVREILAKKQDVAKAMGEVEKLEKKTAKESEAVQGRVAQVRNAVLEAATKQVDEAEALIERGEGKEAGRLLRRLERPLKGTPLEARVAELLEKAKS